jgi:putative phosphonate metabolism protein
VFSRYALYHLPSADPLASFAARWLGWDPVSGRETVWDTPMSGLPRPLRELTRAARKYGFHATLKAPFRLAPGASLDDLRGACRQIASAQPSVLVPHLSLTRIGGFLALTADGDQSGLSALAAACVSGLDHLRAPLSADEISRRRPDTLTPQQRTLLLDWGYPYVMEQFRFHMTLTGDLPAVEAEQTVQALLPLVAPMVQHPYRLSDICLMGEDAETGRFHMVQRLALEG